MYLKLSNGKSRFSIICLRKKGHVCSQKPLLVQAERAFDMGISTSHFAAKSEMDHRVFWAQYFWGAGLFRRERSDASVWAWPFGRGCLGAIIWARPLEHFPLAAQSELGRERLGANLDRFGRSNLGATRLGAIFLGAIPFERRFWARSVWAQFFGCGPL